MTAPIQLVCRDRDGNELARQVCVDEAEARRLMIARNRAIGLALDYPAWGIETDVGPTDPIAQAEIAYQDGMPVN